MGMPTALKFFFFLLQCVLQCYVASGVSWEEWWTYDGISGPAFWGLINPEWSLCNRGRRQSPVNLEPDKLLFDPNLRSLHIDKHRISGYIANTGHSVIFTVDNTTRNHINVTGGPLSYRYQFQEMHMHYGLHDDSGSEHSINDYAFPAEIQIFGFNSQLYSNFSEALFRAQGIVAISLLLQLGDLSNPELRILTDQLEKIKYGGEEVEVKRLSLKGLLPETEYYMTYDGSTTMPACHETVTWVILNKPIYITKQQLHGLRRLMQGDAKHPKAPLGNNFRPPQPLHHRPIRTNIDFNSNKQNAGSKYCPSMYKEVYYKVPLDSALLVSGFPQSTPKGNDCPEKQTFSSIWSSKMVGRGQIEFNSISHIMRGREGRSDERKVLLHPKANFILVQNFKRSRRKMQVELWILCALACGLGVVAFPEGRTKRKTEEVIVEILPMMVYEPFAPMPTVLEFEFDEVKKKHKKKSKKSVDKKEEEEVMLEEKAKLKEESKDEKKVELKGTKAKVTEKTEEKIKGKKEEKTKEKKN